MFLAVYSSLHGFIRNQHNDQLPVGFLAQLVEHCTGIAKVMGSNPVQAWILFRPYFHYCSSSVHNCEDHFHSQEFRLTADEEWGEYEKKKDWVRGAGVSPFSSPLFTGIFLSSSCKPVWTSQNTDFREISQGFLPISGLPKVIAQTTLQMTSTTEATSD